jgi:hypothetical protein
MYVFNFGFPHVSVVVCAVLQLVFAVCFNFGFLHVSVVVLRGVAADVRVLLQ